MLPINIFFHDLPFHNKQANIKLLYTSIRLIPGESTIGLKIQITLVAFDFSFYIFFNFK